MSAVDIELITRVGCHLCEAARQTVQKVSAEFGLSYIEVDIDTRPDLVEQFTQEVPVLRVNGVVKDFWQINAKRLRKTLAQLTEQAEKE